MTISQISLFIGASTLLILAPGPDVIFTITQGLSNGKRAGLLTAIGLALGNGVHTLLAAFGISVIFKTSATAYLVFKILGALYLFYLAYMAFIHRNDSLLKGDENQSNESSVKLISKGFIMNVFNPKVAIFFLAFLPQFVIKSGMDMTIQILILGTIFIILVIIIFGLFGFFAGTLGNWVLERPHFSRNMNVISTLIFIAIGITILFS